MTCQAKLFAPAHAAVILLDTERYEDAILTGRDGPRDPIRGDGLRIVYDGSGTLPATTFVGPDGQVELTGAAEIHQARLAMERADRLAEAFGPELAYDQWKALQS
jgi:hypothetical protein